MASFFDVITVTCFAGLVLAFFRLTNHEPRILIQFLLVGIVFAVANQVGNAGQTALALVLILAGVGYATLLIRK